MSHRSNIVSAIAKVTIAIGMMVLLLTGITGGGRAWAGEKEELQGQKKYIEQRLSTSQSELDGYIKAKEIEFRQFQVDLQRVNQRLQELEKQEKSKSRESAPK